MEKKVDLKKIGRLMDVSAVRTDVTFDEVKQMIDIVKRFDCICASPMPCFTDYTIEKLKDRKDIVTTGVVGFPSGADTTTMKEATAKEMVGLGCEEIDMVINVSALKSGLYDLVSEDVRRVVAAAGGVPVKTILEVCYLSEDEICKASELCVGAGASFIKTGTGWGPSPTTVAHISLIKSVIGNSAFIKAAGGVRSLDLLLEMQGAGCDRFGVGVRSASLILKEAYDRLGIPFEGAVSNASNKDTY